MPPYLRDSMPVPTVPLRNMSLGEASYNTPPESPIVPFAAHASTIPKVTMTQRQIPSTLPVAEPPVYAEPVSDRLLNPKLSSSSIAQPSAELERTPPALALHNLPTSPSPVQRRTSSYLGAMSNWETLAPGHASPSAAYMGGQAPSPSAPSSAGLSEPWQVDTRSLPSTSATRENDEFGWESFDSVPSTPAPIQRRPCLPAPQAVALVQSGAGQLSVVSSPEDVASNVHTSTTHLSIKSCSLPHYTVLQLPHRLVVLDISFSNLTTLPSLLAQCTTLEELNISGNPFGTSGMVAPLSSLHTLQQLRVLLADDCALPALPQELLALSYLQVLGVRRNAITHLPSWLYMLTYLDVLLLEGNEQLSPSWRALVAPLLPSTAAAKQGENAGPSAPAYGAVSMGYPSDPPRPRGFLQKLRSSSARVSPTPERSTRWFSRGKESQHHDTASRTPTGRTSSSSTSQRSVSLPSHTPSQTSQLALPPLDGSSDDPVLGLECFLPLSRVGEESPLAWFAAHGTAYVHQLLQYLRDLDDLLPERHHLAAPPARSLTGSSYVSSPGISVSAAGTSDSTPLGTPGDISVRGGILEEAGALLAQNGYPSPAASSYEAKEDPVKRYRLLHEVVDTEQTYVTGLNELMDIYVNRARGSELPGEERGLPLHMERRIFGHIEGIVQFHRDAFLPSLEQATRALNHFDEDSAANHASMTAQVATRVANVFSEHAAYFKMYMNYVNQYEAAVRAIAKWAEAPRTRPGLKATTQSINALGHMLLLHDATSSEERPNDVAPLSSSEQRRFQQYLRRCREDPRHSQLNLEGYLLLPIQRIPRYRLLLEQLVRCTAHDLLPESDREALARALAHISLVASWVNEGKRQSEQGRRLLMWQNRLRGTFSTPLVQPHRRLVTDGMLRLCRVVKRLGSAADRVSDDDVLEQTCLDLPVHLLLCNDMVVLVTAYQEDAARRSGTHAAEQEGVDLVAVLKPQVHMLPAGSLKDVAQPPATLVSHLHIRIVDARYIMYLAAASYHEAARWCTAINAQAF